MQVLQVDHGRGSSSLEIALAVAEVNSAMLDHGELQSANSTCLNEFSYWATGINTFEKSVAHEINYEILLEKMRKYDPRTLLRPLSNYMNPEPTQPRIRASSYPRTH
jgi:hypothetical protein